MQFEPDQQPASNWQSGTDLHAKIVAMLRWRTVFKKEGRSAHNGSVFSNYTVAHRKELMKAGILQEEECENGLEGAGASTIPSR